MLPIQVDNKHILSIDLGTTFSGVCHFSLGESEPVTHMYKNNLVGEAKIRSCLLYDERERIVDFGSQAYDKYFKLAEHEKKKYYLIKCPKKVLFENPSLDATIVENGRTFEVVKVLADFLKKLVQEPLSAFNLQENEIKWISSVPANWDRDHVQVIKHAFYKAGLIQSPEDDNEVTFQLEPESAAVHVLKGEKSLKNGEKYLLIDCGGGTVDFTAVEVQNKMLKTARYSDAINAGSSIINDKIIELIKSKLGEFSVHLTPQIIHEIDKKWEEIKLNLEDFSGDAYLRLDNIPPDLDKCPAIKRRTITITTDELEQAYIPLFDQIVKFTKTIIDKDIFDKIFCVGGFSQCKPLIQYIKDNIGSDVEEILVPEYGLQSVLQGGAYLGRYPSIISTRRSKYGYGIESEVEFDQKRHPVSKMKKYPMGSRIPIVCAGIYTPIIAHNQEVKENFFVEKKFTKNQHEGEMNINVYRTMAPKISYVDDVFCSILETLHVDVSGLKPGETFRVQFSVSGSFNELNIAVVPDDIGKRVEATVEFATVHRVNHFQSHPSLF